MPPTPPAKLPPTAGAFRTGAFLTTFFTAFFTGFFTIFFGALAAKPEQLAHTRARSSSTRSFIAVVEVSGLRRLRETIPAESVRQKTSQAAGSGEDARVGREKPLPPRRELH